MAKRAKMGIVIASLYRGNSGVEDMFVVIDFEELGWSYERRV